MRRNWKYLAATVAAALVFVGAATAQPLDELEKSYIQIYTLSATVSMKCGYVPIDAARVALGDKLGVDASTLITEMIEAAKLLANVRYDRNLLRPEVTRFMTLRIGAERDVSEANLAGYCRENVPKLLDLGLIERK